MNPVIAGLIFLRVTSFRNALVARIRRLRQPKYLLGGVIGVAYLYFVFLRRVGPARDQGALQGALPLDQLPLVLAACALAVSLFIALCWLWPRERAALGFSEAD